MRISLRIPWAPPIQEQRKCQNGQSRVNFDSVGEIKKDTNHEHKTVAHQTPKPNSPTLSSENQFLYGVVRQLRMTFQNLTAKHVFVLYCI